MNIRKTAIFAVIITVCVIAAGAVGYTVYQLRKPQPVSIDLSGQAPDSIDFITDDVITDFARNDAPAVVMYDDFVIQYGTLVSYTGDSDRVVIPDNIGITIISDDAFAHSGIVSVVIPDGVTNIEFGTFHSCSKLETVILPDSITRIGERAFYYCYNLTSITIPGNVTSIGESAFSSCSSLISVTIPSSVTSIDKQAFYYCTSLQQFVVDQNNTNYTSVDGVLFNKDMTNLIQFPSGKTGSYTIPGSVTRIGSRAFEGCTSLTSVTIPNSVTRIEEMAFEDCTSLISITIPDSVYIEYLSFRGCPNLKQITVIPNGGNPAYIQELLERL